MVEKYSQILKNFKIPIALSLVGIVLIIGGIIFTDTDSKRHEYPQESIVEAQKVLTVDISGAVQNPGVYRLKEGDRIEQAIASAGGFSTQVNKDYISKYINLALKLTDGMKIYVPFEGEIAPISAGSGTVAGAQTQGKVNINIASQSELEALPGIGPVTASKIISDRPYQKIEDLLDKKIVGKATFEKIKDQIIVY
ncbi:MAG: helix-hairpin-helix domain-containing protein [Patescibacteria group bacterium]